MFRMNYIIRRKIFIRWKMVPESPPLKHILNHQIINLKEGGGGAGADDTFIFIGYGVQNKNADSF